MTIAYLFSAYFNRFDDVSFSISHVFASKTPSSKRTIYFASLLNMELRNIHLTYMGISLFMLSKKNQEMDQYQIYSFLSKEYPLFSQSSKFFLLPNLAAHCSPDEKFDCFISQQYPDKSVIFSGKKNLIDETPFLLSQLSDDCHSISIVSSLKPKFSIIDTFDGGVYYLQSKLMFILIPRNLAIKFPAPHLFFQALSSFESKKAKLSCNRGKSRRVYFESNDSNYVDVGVGVSRSMTGLYMKSARNVPLSDIEAMNNCFSFIEDCVSQYLPSSLLDAVDTAVNAIELEDFSTLPTTSEIRNSLGLKSSKSNNTVPSSQPCKYLPSASFGRNNLLPLHTDKDMFLSVVHLHSDDDIVRLNDSHSHYEQNSGIVKFFTFDNSTSVALRSGDVLIFNPTIPHCVSSSTDAYSHCNTFCISHYFKTSIAGRNNNSINFSI